MHPGDYHLCSWMGCTILDRPNVQSGNPPGLMAPPERADGSLLGGFLFNFVCQLRPFVDGEGLCSVTHVLVISCLDYFNKLLNGAAFEKYPGTSAGSEQF